MRTAWALCSLLAALLASGCAGPRFRAYSLQPASPSDTAALQKARQRLSTLYPARYRATQRAILTIGRKQYVCDGVLHVTPEEGHHLAIVSALGLVTDLRLTTNGAAELRKVTPLFREAWSQDYVAESLRWLFRAERNLELAGRLEDGRLVLGTPVAADGPAVRYVFSASGDTLEEVEVCRQGRRCLHAVFGAHRTVVGHPTPVPVEFRIHAGAYRLELRTVELAVAEPGGGRP